MNKPFFEDPTKLFQEFFKPRNHYVHLDPQTELIRAAGMMVKAFSPTTSVQRKAKEELIKALEAMK